METLLTSIDSWRLLSEAKETASTAEPEMPFSSEANPIEEGDENEHVDLMSLLFLSIFVSLMAG